MGDSSVSSSSKDSAEVLNGVCKRPPILCSILSPSNNKFIYLSQCFCCFFFAPHLTDVILTILDVPRASVVEAKIMRHV